MDLNENELRLKYAELEQSVKKLTKENHNLTKFNEDLRDQIKLLTGKLNLHQKLNKTETSLCSACGAKSSSSSWSAESSKKNVSIKDLVTSAAQETMSMNDYIYDEKSRTYYSKSTGWYYYSDQNLFYDPKSRNYYNYVKSSGEYKFHSSLDDQNNLKRSAEHIKSKKRQAVNKNESNEVDTEEGELSSSSSEMECDGEEYVVRLPPNMEKAKDTLEVPPSVRLIVQKSNVLDLGSLVLVTCNGLKIGSSSQCELSIDEPSVDKIHAQIVYSDSQASYMVRDLNSINGTYVNDKLIVSGENVRLKHDTFLRFGETEFMAHIHEKDNTCVYCEPGCVQARLAECKSITSVQPVLNKEEKERQRKKELKQLQKKYGVNPFAEEKIASDYNDRAQERRKVKGIDCPFEKTEQVSSIDTPIASTNKGFKLLEKAGWKKDEKQDSKLIEIRLKNDRKGLGC